LNNIDNPFSEMENADIT